eukprot:scaffold210727_cov23-Tisochrysis_lutea.AAC.1
MKLCGKCVYWCCALAHNMQVRGALRGVKVAAPHDRVLKNECCFSFDTAESPGGIYINLRTFQVLFTARNRSDAELAYLSTQITQVGNDPVRRHACTSTSVN